MAEVRIKQLGLAAYVKMQGEHLLKVDGREFIFDSVVSAEEWRVKYNNSCCMKHDSIVCELRHFLK